jgi:hypothetical protein
LPEDKGKRTLSILVGVELRSILQSTSIECIDLLAFLWEFALTFGMDNLSELPFNKNHLFSLNLHQMIFIIRIQLKSFLEIKICSRMFLSNKHPKYEGWGTFPSIDV